jgi:hypothetical protein
MSRMIDRVLARGVTPPPWAVRSGAVLAVRQRPLLDALSTAEVIVADNVAEYWAAGTDQEEWYWSDDFPCLAPPFERFWIECRAPRMLVSKRWGTIQVPPWEAWGALVQSTKRPEGGWHVEFVVLAEPRKRRALLFGAMMFSLDSSGAAPGAVDDRATNPNVQLMAPDIPGLTSQGGSIRGFRGALQSFVQPLALAICFMHCRNVDLIECRPDDKLSRAHRRRHGYPLVRYHVLEIEPLKQVLITEGRSEEVGLRRALHICRGHFKDYRQRGLFGRHHGIYWWDHYLRGDIDCGAVVKDYRVLDPVDAQEVAQ